MTIRDSYYNMPPGSDSDWARYDADDDGRITDYEIQDVRNSIQDVIDILDIRATEADAALVEPLREALTAAIALAEDLLYKVRNGSDDDRT